MFPGRRGPGLLVSVPSSRPELREPSRAWLRRRPRLLPAPFGRGVLDGSAGVSAGRPWAEKASGAFPGGGGPPVRRGSAGPGAGSLRGLRGRRAGPSFRRSGGPFNSQDPHSPRVAKGSSGGTPPLQRLTRQEDTPIPP